MITSTLSLKSSFLTSSSSYRKITSLKSNDKVEVKEYFDNEGFNRWNKIYSNSDEVNRVQLGIIIITITRSF
jgi:magnesium-protoporphyrin O-methyltransferase